MEWFKLIGVDFLPTIIWPSVVFVLVLFFRAEIRDFSKRLTKLGPGGAEAVPPQQDTSIEENSGLSLPTTNSDPLLQPWENPIREAVQQLIAERDFDSDKLNDLLIQELAHSRQRIAFETISRIIFGTQISLLRHLRSSSPKTREDLSDIYKEHEDQVVQHTPTNFDLWVGYLLQMELVEMKGNGYSITEMGKAYLTFADTIGVSEIKSL